MGAPPSNQQRIEALEKSLSELRSTMAEQIGMSVGTATSEMQQNFLEKLAATMEQNMADQLKYQEEVRSTLSSLKLGDGCGVATSGVRGKNIALSREEREAVDRPEGSGVGSGPFGGFGGDNGNYSQGRNGGSNWRHKKLDLPVFAGINPDGWLLRAERYFSFYRLSEEEQLEAAVVSLDGDALLWYQFEHGRRPIRRWEELKGMLLRQFRPSSSGSLYEQWLNLSQTSGVIEYRRRFIELMAPLTGVPEEIATGQFINGLREDVKVEVRLLGPRSLDHAMDLSVKVEDKLRAGWGKKFDTKGASPNYYSVLSYSPQSGTSSYSSFKSQSSSVAPSTRSVSAQSNTASTHTQANQKDPGYLPVAKPIGVVKRLSDKEF